MLSILEHSTLLCPLSTLLEPKSSIWRSWGVIWARDWARFESTLSIQALHQVGPCWACYSWAWGPTRLGVALELPKLVGGQGKFVRVWFHLRKERNQIAEGGKGSREIRLKCYRAPQRRRRLLGGVRWTSGEKSCVSLLLLYSLASAWAYFFHTCSFLLALVFFIPFLSSCARSTSSCCLGAIAC